MEQMRLGNEREDQEDRRKKESIVESWGKKTIGINENKENEKKSRE